MGTTQIFTKEPKGILTIIKKPIENSIKKSFTKKIEALEVKPAWMDFDLPSDTIDFKGLEDGFKNNDTLINILTIHGISTKNPDNFDIMIYGIAEKMKFNLEPKIKIFNMAKHYSGKMAGVSQIRLIEFCNTKNQKLRFFDIYWSPMTFPVKKFLNELDNEGGMDERRGFFPKSVKDKMVNDGLSDVTLMINKFGPELHHCLDSAFHLMLMDDPFSPTISNINKNDKRKNNYFISGSLGSKLLFEYFVTCLDTAQLNRTDSLMPYREHISQAATNNARLMREKLHTFFMLTNQLPLVALKNLDPNMEYTQENYIRHTYSNWDALSPNHDDLNIVAFNDPNDILSFILPPCTESEINVTNVQLNVANGIEFNVYHLVKLLKKLDGLIFLLSKRNIKEIRKDIKKDEEYSDEIRRQKLAELNQLNRELKRPYKVKKISLVNSLLPLMDKDKPKQTIVFDFGTAHSGPPEDPRIIEMLTFGTKNIGEADEMIDRSRFKKPK